MKYDKQIVENIISIANQVESSVNSVDAEYKLEVLKMIISALFPAIL